LSILPDLGIGLATGLSGTIAGCIAAMAFAPKQFAMPSMMAELRMIEPRFGVLAFATASVTTVAAITLGMIPTLWRVHRAPFASTGNLDEGSAATVMALLYASCRERGRTLLLVTHARGSLQPNETVLELRAGSLARPRDDVRPKIQTAGM
jgi:hypothetical protein